MGGSRGARRDRGQAGQPRGDAGGAGGRPASAVRRRDPRPGGPQGVRRERLLPRGMTRIAAVEVRRYGVALEPPFAAAWDPVPRARSEVAVVIVRADDGTA